MRYSRILLKLSGEALMGNQGHGIDPDTVRSVVSQVIALRELGLEIGIVVGGGNIYRGMRAEKQGIDRVTGDYMGMVATALNGLALQSMFEKAGQPAVVQTALAMERVAEPFIQRRAVELLEKGTIVIFACGTGNPYFTTDTAAALRAMEIGADSLFKATKVDGVYDKDPEIHKDARFFSEITYMEALNKGLKVMDATAITLCMENNLPIIVFNIKGEDNMKRVVLGERIGTIVLSKVS
jgi:uridylate kinase